MKFKILILILVLFLMINLVSAAWWNASWGYEKEIVINSTVSSTLADFTPYLKLDTATLISAGKMNSSCKDLRIINNDNATALDFEIELGTCNTSNTVVWIRIPSLTTGNYSVYAYYGNPGVADGQNVLGVWQNYTFVFHHNGWQVSKPTGSVTWSAAVTNSTTSWMTGENSTYHNTGQQGDDMRVIPAPGCFSHNFSRGFYIYWRIRNEDNSWDNTCYPLDFESLAGSVGVNLGFCGGDSGARCDVDTDKYAYAESILGATNWAKISTDLGYSNWHMLSFTGNTNDNVGWTYVDGVFNTRTAITYTTNSVTICANGTGNSGIGQTGNFNQGAWLGYIGETRLGEFNATSNWIKADYGQLYYVGTEQTAPPVNTCTYTSGNWNVLFSDYCNITSNVAGGGSNLTITGLGIFTTTANITGFKNINCFGVAGQTSYVRCFNSGCFR